MRKGAKTREAILERAVSIASQNGLSGLTIGGLAKELELSKSGLIARFGTKEALDLAVTTGRGRAVFKQCAGAGEQIGAWRGQGASPF